MFPTEQGSWHLHHDAFDAAGQYIGALDVAHHVGRGSIRQTYSPQSLTEAHPLAVLRGELAHRFAVEGDVFTFDGHDFTGTARRAGDDLVTYRGLMTRFGYHIHSNLIMPAPQLIFGFTELTSALHTVALLISAGQRAGDENEPFPAFEGARWSSAIAPRWVGTIETITPDGTQKREGLTRRANGLRVEEHTAQRKLITWELETWAPDAIVSGTVTGLARLMGHMLTIEGVAGPRTHLELVEIVHPSSEWLVGVRRWSYAQSLARTEVIALRPA